MAGEPRLVVSTLPLPADILQNGLTGALVVKAGQDDLVEAVPGALVIVGDWEHRVRIGADVIAAARVCRLVQQPTAGYENVDAEAARKAGIPVANAGPANAVAVAEFALMAAIGGLRRMREAIRDAETPGWAQTDWIQKDLRQLSGCTVGILGLGSVGTALAERLRAFGPRVFYSKRARLEPARETELGVQFLELDELLRQSDILVIAVPLNDATRGLLGRERLQLLPPDALVVNVARGDIMDYSALADLLRSGRLAGAALDVFPTEPPGNIGELTALPNVLLSPHIAGVTRESKRAILVNSLANIQRVIDGKAPEYVVNGVKT